ncbi:4Fe-4S binding protein [Sulfurimonas sp. C5]|uniref:4Fe-4S binding protein n=1 Tax=Sulfurimonas sp. C5 TaxID=3036947 RepID=UPI0024541CAF|nr:4Fe-4S binding protein [Sulfurimonas sp. C5]MDH4944128.1 4Fe-4S binding protein [Sulfurimonas sp. C5]
MVDQIKRDNNDLFKYAITKFLFKNQSFLMLLRIVVSLVFFYAIYYGFTHQTKENLFTWAVFWGIFWALFMVITLPTLGRVFCGICPHGFLGKYITKFGLQKKMPKWLQNRYIGLGILMIGWWGVYYLNPGLFRSPLGTAVMFSVMTVLAFVLYFLYKDMSYCKSVCPIGVLTRAYGKMSFTWLGTYKEECSSCKTFECASACPQNLKPFTFDKRDSITDCTLCMDCTKGCEAVAFRITKPSFSLFKKFQTMPAEIWAYILILAAIPVTMSFHHGINRSNAAGDMIWTKTAHWVEQYINFGTLDAVGLFAFLYAVIFSVVAAVAGMYVASKILQKDFKSVFYDLGYAYAPLFIIGSIAHTLESFFTHEANKIAEGFGQAVGMTLHVAPLASRGDSWLHIFGALKWIAIIWALVILYKRLAKIDATKMKKMVAFPFAASLIIFFLSVNLYRVYVFKTYGMAKHSHHSMQHKTAKKPQVKG